MVIIEQWTFIIRFWIFSPYYIWYDKWANNITYLFLKSRIGFGFFFSCNQDWLQMRDKCRTVQMMPLSQYEDRQSIEGQNAISIEICEQEI